MLADKLRKAVLQAALQGNLTKQLPTDGNAADLVAEIKKEKERLIKEKKIKKQKPLPPITAEEIPFEIPDNWCWVRLSTAVLINPRNKLDDEKEVSFIPMKYIEDGYKNKHSFEKRLWKDIKSNFTHIKENDLGIAKITPCFQNRKSVVFKNLINGYGAGTTELNIIKVLPKTIMIEYLLWFVKSSYFINGGVKSFTGTAGQQRIHKDYLSYVLLPLPPLAEQRRIVEKIEEVLNHIEHLKVNEEKLSLLQKNFPDKLKKSLLQAAIQGKLTEQLSTDDNVEDLLAEIRKEKEKLIKEKKIKKQKPLPPITEEEIPFEIPENWRWVRLGDIGIWEAGSTPNRTNSKYYLNGQVPWVKTGDLNDEILTRVSENITELAVEETAIKLKPIGSILIAMYGATIGKLAILGIKATTNQACCACIPFNGIYNKYLYYYLMSYRDNFKKMGAGGAQPNISREKIIKTLVPLPSLKEQKRIVKQLERFLINIK